MGQRPLSCYLVENPQKDEAYVTRTFYDVPKALLDEFLLQNGYSDYTAVQAAIIDLMRKVVEERKTKS